jgi:hypothetical protein
MMRRQCLSKACAVLLCMLAVSAPLGAVACKETKDVDEVSVTGPVPPFEHRSRTKCLVEDRVFYAIGWPEFGVPFLDGVISKLVAEHTSAFVGDIESFSVEEEEDGYIPAKRFLLGYELSASRPGILSITYWFWYYESPMGHAMHGPASHTYDLREKKLLRLGDIFPRWESAKKKLLPLLKDEDFQKECEGLIDIALDALSPDDTHFTLSPEGLSLSYAVSPSWAWASCMRHSVDKNDLKKIGANMRYWAREKKGGGR